MLREELKKLIRSPVRDIVKERIKTFEELGRGSSKEIFRELCFCILAANYSAERAIEIEKRIGDGFATMPKEALREALRKLGYRFPNTRAEYVASARKFRASIKKIITSFRCEEEAREWLVGNVRGVGYKEASHFLRNIGFKNLAIIDFHIVDVLVRNGLIPRPGAMTGKRYREIEALLRALAGALHLSLAELDLYLWYLETGKILK